MRRNLPYIRWIKIRHIKHAARGAHLIYNTHLIYNIYLYYRFVFCVNWELWTVGFYAILPVFSRYLLIGCICVLLILVSWTPEMSLLDELVLTSYFLVQYTSTEWMPKSPTNDCFLFSMPHITSSWHGEDKEMHYEIPLVEILSSIHTEQVHKCSDPCLSKFAHA